MVTGKKIAVYTAIMGGFDSLQDPLIVTPGIDYICFTDNKKIKSKVWQIRYIENKDIKSRKKAREIKLLPHIYLSDYDYSIWVDGNIVILKNLQELIDNFILENKKISTFKHFERNCIYEEGVCCAYLKKDDPLSIYRQLAYCISENYPVNNGLAETNVLIREHSDSKVIEFMKEWWDSVNKRCIRDQLSFNLCAYKLKMEIDYIKGNARYDIDIFKCKTHKLRDFSDLILIFKSFLFKIKKHV